MNIVIAGVTCSGKTTLAKKIQNTYRDVSIMPQDSYFKDLQEIPKHKGRYLMDSINAFEYGEYQQDSVTLLDQGQVHIPRYDISMNRRFAKDLLLLKKELIIFEGLHAIKLLPDVDALKIFLMTSLSECLKRRIARDSKQYGVEPSVIEEYFKEVVEPMYKEYILPQSALADVVIREGDDMEWVLKKYIRS